MAGVSEVPLGGSTVVAGRYALGEVLGRGGMAEVYRAWDQVLERPVAVKMLHLATSDAAARARFARETSTLAKLNHPGLVTVLDAGTVKDRPFLVMELVDGAALSTWVRGAGLDPRYVAAAGAQVADALRYVHGAGIVHRDVTPANILLARDGRVLLADFGIARLAADTAHLTAQGLMVGTVGYLSPEQVTGGDVGPAADVYALGLTLLEALTGASAYPGPAAEAALARLTTPPLIPKTLPPPWPDLLRQMTAHHPSERPTAAEVAGILVRAATGVDAAAATVHLFTLPPTRPLPVPGSTAVNVPAVDVPAVDVPAVDVPAVDVTVVDVDADTRRTLVGHSPPATARTTRPTRPTRLVMIAAAIVVILAGLLVAVLTIDPAGQTTTSDLPAGLSPQLSEDVRELHEAVNG
jgi:eukaryotic-like serine/threonine-protein kinase